MTEWNFCPECAVKLEVKNGWPTCPDGHFTKYFTPVAGTAGFIRNNNEFLIIKRANEPQKGWWDLPGGFVEYDESAEECLLREIKEETSLSDLEIVSFIGAFPGSYSGKQKVLDLAYLIDSGDRDLTLSDENTDYKWVNLENIPELAFEDLNAALKVLKLRGDIISA